MRRTREGLARQNISLKCTRGFSSTLCRFFVLCIDFVCLPHEALFVPSCSRSAKVILGQLCSKLVRQVRRVTSLSMSSTSTASSRISRVRYIGASLHVPGRLRTSTHALLMMSSLPVETSLDHRPTTSITSNYASQLPRQHWYALFHLPSLPAPALADSSRAVRVGRVFLSSRNWTRRNGSTPTVL